MLPLRARAGARESEGGVTLAVHSDASPAAHITVDAEKHVVTFAGGATLRLTGQQAKLMARLLKDRPKVVKTDQLYQDLYWNAKDCEMRDPAILKVVICNLRRRLRPFGVEIMTVWGTGYFIPGADT